MSRGASPTTLHLLYADPPPPIWSWNTSDLIETERILDKFRIVNKCMIIRISINYYSDAIDETMIPNPYDSNIIKINKIIYFILLHMNCG